MIRTMKFLDGLFRIPSTLHPDAVQTVALRVISLDDGKRRGVLYDHRVSTNERLVSDAAKLMYAGVCTDIRTVGDLDVAGERRGIRHDDFASDPAVVCNVRLRHQEI